MVSVTEPGPLAGAVDCHGTSTAIKFNTAIHLCLLWATPFSTTPKRHLSPFIPALSLSLSPSLPPKKQQQVALSFSLSGIRSVRLFQACTTAGREHGLTQHFIIGLGTNAKYIQQHQITYAISVNRVSKLESSHCLAIRSPGCTKHER